MAFIVVVFFNREILNSVEGTFVLLWFHFLLFVSSFSSLCFFPLFILLLIYFLMKGKRLEQNPLWMQFLFQFFFFLHFITSFASQYFFSPRKGTSMVNCVDNQFRMRGFLVREGKGFVKIT